MPGPSKRDGLLQQAGQPVMRRFLHKLKGSGDSAPPRPSFRIMALAGALVLVVVGMIYNNATRAGSYPRY